MSHTTEIGDYIFIHDNFDGNVSIHYLNSGETIAIPMDVLLEFIGQAVQHAKISAIEDLEGREFIISQLLK